MTSVSPALASLPAQPASSGSAAGPKPDSPDTFSSTLDREMANREMANRSPRRAPDASKRATHRTDPHAAHRPAALRGRAGTGSAKGATDATAGDGATRTGTGAAAGTAPAATTGVPADGADVIAAPGTDAMLAAAVALAQQQVTVQPTDPRVALAVPGGSGDAHDTGAETAVETDAGSKPGAAAAHTAGRPLSSGAAAASLGAPPGQPAAPDATAIAGQADGSPTPTAAAGAPTGTVPTGTPTTGSDSPATATSIADALAADAAATSAAGTSAGTPGSAGAGTGGPGSQAGSNGSASSTPQQPDPSGLPAPVVGATTPDATRSDAASAPAVVTPGTITAAEAGKVAETASNAATAALLNAAGAGAPLTMPDVTRASTDSAAARTAAALPSHVAELARLAHISSDGTARLTVRLDPPELGAVTLHMTSRGSAVELSLRAETPAGAAALAGQQVRVRDLLADHGFDLSHFTIAGVSGGDDAGFADPRQRDQNGSSAGDPSSGESRFSTDPDRDDRGSARSGFAGSDGFGSGGRSGSRADDGWSETTSPARRTSATTATEGTWL